MIYIIKRICNAFKEIPSVINLSKVEFFLTIATGTLLGVIVGMLISPRKNQKFGCDNGNNYVETNEFYDDDFEDEFEEE